MSRNRMYPQLILTKSGKGIAQRHKFIIYIMSSVRASSPMYTIIMKILRITMHRTKEYIGWVLWMCCCVEGTESKMTVCCPSTERKKLDQKIDVTAWLRPATTGRRTTWQRATWRRPQRTGRSVCQERQTNGDEMNMTTSNGRRGELSVDIAVSTCDC